MGLGCLPLPPALSEVFPDTLTYQIITSPSPHWTAPSCSPSGASQPAHHHSLRTRPLIWSRPARCQHLPGLSPFPGQPGPRISVNTASVFRSFPWHHQTAVLHCGAECGLEDVTQPRTLKLHRRGHYPTWLGPQPFACVGPASLPSLSNLCLLFLVSPTPSIPVVLKSSFRAKRALSEGPLYFLATKINLYLLPVLILLQPLGPSHPLLCCRLLPLSPPPSVLRTPSSTPCFSPVLFLPSQSGFWRSPHHSASTCSLPASVSYTL